MIARDIGRGKPGSMMRRSECITAVMVLPPATACDVSATDSASTDKARFGSIVGHFQREI
jgi:hypothetical protein